MHATYDVIVVGSGPAGSSAAWRLAKAGLAVAVIDKADLPRYKTCGGGIIGRTLQALPMDVHHVFEQICHTAELTIHPAGLSFTTHRPTPIVCMTMRDQFDFALLSAAQAAGAFVCQQRALEDITFHKDFVTLVTSAGAMKAQFVVAADGALSMVARRMGTADGRILIPALEYEVTVPLDRLHAFHGVARFDFGWLPDGYAWAFPKRQHLSIGVLSMTRRGGELKVAMARYLDRLGCGSATQINQHGFVIPIRPRSGPFVDQRVLFVGDAAGLTDPVTGEGISFAVRSGLLAAESLIGGRLAEASVGSEYMRTLERTILPELRTARWLARLLYNFPRVRSWAFSQQGQRLCEAVTDVMAGTRTYRDLVFNRRTLHRLLTSPSLVSSIVKPVNPDDGQV